MRTITPKADRILITINSEYHMRRSICIGVRDRGSQSWHRDHMATGAELLGSMQVTVHGSWKMNVGIPEPGQRLYFDNDLLTSALHEVLSTETPTPLAA